MTAPETPAAPTPAGGAAPRAVPPTPPAAGPGAYYRPVDADSGILLVSVPADAKVFVNGKATTSTGADRQYISRGLDAGQVYAYEVRAEFTRDGKTVTETKSAKLSGGSIGNLSFNDSVDTASPKTVLKLNVPADAKVLLSGHETTSTGSVREFTTTSLSAGAHWDNYKIEVTSGGETKAQTISLTAGDSRELTFDFGTSRVASAR